MIGDTAIFATDRGLTGMNGMGFDGIEAAQESDRFPAQLAARVFAADDAVRRVYVASNEVVLTRAGGWDEAALATSGEVIETFFLFYGA
ncbi:MAG: hypothetical protein EHM57_06575 [Actinobacteria bacterium]|nr:MAG: hypothetical protein EHM57_06575 [Actinomycetota bacterium]